MKVGNEAGNTEMGSKFQQTTSIKISYLSRMPAKFIRRMAGFQKEEGSYVLPRAGYEPPASLQRQIWPWLEGWLARVQAQIASLRASLPATIVATVKKATTNRILK